jgi:hypothetical protein
LPTEHQFEYFEVGRDDELVCAETDCTCGEWREEFCADKSAVWQVAHLSWEAHVRG